MIIRCDQCKTRFRLDDSKVTVSGIRVRCSKCKHTFVVKKEEEEESLIEGFSPDTQGASAEERKQEQDKANSVTEQTWTGRASDGISFQQDNMAASGQDISGGGEFDKASSIEDDFSAFKAEGLDSSSDLSFGEHSEEQSPFAWPEVQENEEEQERESDFRFGVKPEMGDGGGDEPESDDFREGDTAESPVTAGREEGDGEEGTDSFAADFDKIGEIDDRGAMDVFSLGEVGNADPDDRLSTGNDAHDIGTADSHIVSADKADDLPQLGQVEFAATKERESVPFNFDTASETGLSSHNSEMGGGEELPPLSITSRRKRSILSVMVFSGILCLLILIVAGGVYFFKADSTALKIPSLSDVKNRLMTGQWKNAQVLIKNLDGTYVRNSQGVDLFIIRGEALNQSDRPSPAVRIQGYIYGNNGQILSAMQARFGEILSNDRLAVLPVNEIEALSGNKSGKVIRDATMQPGKSVPFQIVFVHVPDSAGEYGAEVTGSAGGTP